MRSGLRSITWPASVTRIPNSDTLGWGMFSGSIYLQTVIIPEGVTEIGNDAFMGCRALTSVTLPSTIERIGSRAFSGLSALTTIVIPDTVENISFENSGGWASFYGTSNLTLASQAALRRRGYTGGF